VDCKRSNASTNGANFPVVRQGRKVQTGGEMRKFATILALSAVIAGTASAVDMGGKIGFGVGPAPITVDFKPGSILEPALFGMRVGISNFIIVEPKILFTQIGLEDKTDTTNTMKYSASIMGICERTLFTLKSKEKSNLYGTVGLGFGNVTGNIEPEDTLVTKQKLSGMLYGVSLGLALEHFITPNFSVFISSEGGYAGGSVKGENQDGSSPADKILEVNGHGLLIGNTQFSLMFFWYL